MRTIDNDSITGGCPIIANKKLKKLNISLQTI